MAKKCSRWMKHASLSQAGEYYYERTCGKGRRAITAQMRHRVSRYQRKASYMVFVRDELVAEGLTNSLQAAQNTATAILRRGR